VRWRKKGFLVLGFLCLLIIGLVIGIIVVNNSGDESEEEPEDDYVLVKVKEIDDETTVKEAIEIYQRYIDNATNDKEKIGFYVQRIDFIIHNDDNGDYSTQAIKDAIEVDNNLKSINSALQVVDLAEILGDLETMKQYEKIADERLGGNENTNEEVNG